MLVVGLVGKPAAGKSTVARLLAEHGARVIDADRIAHEVLDEPAVADRIAAEFGGGVVDAAGRVLRPALAERVFGPTPAHATALESLESLVHPRVRRRIEETIAGIREDASREAAGRAPGRSGPVVVLDVPLLVQAGWLDLCDRVIVVGCDEAVRQERLAGRGWSQPERESRDAAWHRRYAADRIPEGKTTAVDASRNLAYTRPQVDDVWAELDAGERPA